MNPATARKTIGSQEFAKATGLTLRQVQYWSEQKIINPKLVPGQKGQEGARAFELSDALRARVILRLVKLGFLNRDARKMARNIVTRWERWLGLRDCVA